MSKLLLKKLFSSLGYKVSRYDPRRDPKKVLDCFLSRYGINLVFDVGANSGQYAMKLRQDGFQGKIVSFEPLSSAYSQLESHAKNDDQWTVNNCALGVEAGETEIHIAGNSWSSSILEMLPAHSDEAPESAYVAKEKIRIETLDLHFARNAQEHDQVLLKIDTQGYTKKVLEGASQSLPRISGVMVEMSLVPLYDGEPLIDDITSLLYRQGFSLVYIDPEFINAETGQQLQVNGYFFRV